MNTLKQILLFLATKLRFLNSEQELDLEALVLWIFLFITAFRAFFANLTLHIGANIKWDIPDINLAATLPMLYSLLSNSHRRYLDSKTNNSDKGASDDGTNKGNS